MTPTLYSCTDISYWQGKKFSESPNSSGINWDTYTQVSITSVIRVTKGDFRDYRFEEYYRELSSRNKRFGGYHYLTLTESAETQARNFLDTVKGKKFTLPVFLDVEVIPPLGGMWSPAKYLNHVWQWIEIVSKERRDLRLGIYTRGALWNRYIVGTQANKVIEWVSTKKLLLWVARYTDKDHPWNDNINVLRPIGWKDFDLWQWTDKGDGKSAGLISYGLDLNKINPYGDFLEGVVDPEPPVDPPKPEPSEFPFVGVCTAQSLNVRKTPDGALTGSCSHGENVTVYAEVDDDRYGRYVWYLIRKANDLVGWVASDWIEHKE